MTEAAGPLRRLHPEPAVDLDYDDACRDPRRREPGATPAGRPWLAVNMISTADGGIESGGVTAALGSPSDRALFLALRRVADVILVGSATVAAETYGPPAADAETRAARESHGSWPRARIAIVSNRLAFDYDTAIFASDPPPIVVTSQEADPDALAAARAHAEVIVAGTERVDPALALDRLGEIGAGVVLAEGGPRLNGELFAADVVDELCLTFAPLLVSGEARRVVDGPRLDPPRRLALAHVLYDDDYLFLRYLRATSAAHA